MSWLDWLSIFLGVGGLVGTIFGFWTHSQSEKKDLKIKQLMSAMMSVKHNVDCAASTIEQLAMLSNKSRPEMFALKNHIEGISKSISGLFYNSKIPENITSNFITEQDLGGRELGSKQVWILTNDLYESEESLFENIVTENLQKGTIYRYIVPDNHSVKHKAKSLFERYRNKISSLTHQKYHHLAIPSKDYPFMTEVLLYDADILERRDAYWMIPELIDGHRYYLHLDRITCDAFVIYFESIWHKYNENGELGHDSK